LSRFVVVERFSQRGRNRYRAGQPKKKNRPRGRVFQVNAIGLSEVGKKKGGALYRVNGCGGEISFLKNCKSWMGGLIKERRGALSKRAGHERD